MQGQAWLRSSSTASEAIHRHVQKYTHKQHTQAECIHKHSNKRTLHPHSRTHTRTTGTTLLSGGARERQCNAPHWAHTARQAGSLGSRILRRRRRERTAGGTVGGSASAAAAQGRMPRSSKAQVRSILVPQRAKSVRMQYVMVFYSTAHHRPLKVPRFYRWPASPATAACTRGLLQAPGFTVGMLPRRFRSAGRVVSGSPFKPRAFRRDNRLPFVVAGAPPPPAGDPTPAS